MAPRRTTGQKKRAKLRFYTAEERQKVIDLHETLQDKTERNIAEITGFSLHFINKTITAYWKEKAKSFGK